MSLLSPSSSALAMALMLSVATSSATPAALLNIDFTAHLNPNFNVKRGPAAIGQGASDYWNIYSRDVDSAFNWRDAGELRALLWADGSSSPADLQVSNAGGAWGTDSLDAMFRSYLYPLSRTGPISVLPDRSASGALSPLLLRARRAIRGECADPGGLRRSRLRHQEHQQ